MRRAVSGRALARLARAARNLDALRFIVNTPDVASDGALLRAQSRATALGRYHIHPQ